MLCMLDVRSNDTAYCSVMMAIMLRPLMPPPSMHRMFTGVAVVAKVLGVAVGKSGSSKGVASLPPCTRKSKPQPRLESRPSLLAVVRGDGGAATGAPRVREPSKPLESRCIAVTWRSGRWPVVAHTARWCPFGFACELRGFYLQLFPRAGKKKERLQLNS